MLYVVHMGMFNYVIQYRFLDSHLNRLLEKDETNLSKADQESKTIEEPKN